MEKPILEHEIEAKINGTATVENNIAEVKEYALKLREYYSKLVFTEEQISEAKEERASINKIATKIADYRKGIVAEFKKPIEVFETTAKETEKILKETSEFVDTQVKKFENEEKEKKKIQIVELYESMIEELKDIVPFEKLFNEKWLNKTTSFSSIETELKEKLENIRSGLKAIEELHSEYELEIKNTYLQDFNLANAIYKNTQLQNQKKALEKVAEVHEEKVQEQVESMLKEEVPGEEIDPVQSYTLKITAPLSKMLALRKFLNLNDMKFEKIN